MTSRDYDVIFVMSQYSVVAFGK